MVGCNSAPKLLVALALLATAARPAAGQGAAEDARVGAVSIALPAEPPRPLSDSGRRAVAGLALEEQPRSRRSQAPLNCLGRIVASTGIGTVAGLGVGFGTILDVGSTTPPGQRIVRFMVLGAGVGLVAGAIWCTQ